MPVDHIRYDLLVREALRGVVRRVIADVARNGLPGDHHFYIAFETRTPGVRMSQRLRTQYPEEMTIVLQHQFWDLAVTDSGIEVGLSFGGVPEKLFVPFDAIKGFFDPSVQFGLEFEVASQKAESEAVAPVTADAPAPPLPAPASAGSAIPPPAPTALKSTGNRADHPAPEASGAPSEAEPEAKPESGAEVVRLDRFRKK